MMECASPGCDQAGTKSCSTCRKEFYCCSKCQKTEWKTHKIFCLLFNRMPAALIPTKDVYSIVDEVLSQTEEQIAKIGIQRYLILLQHSAIFVENQCGKRIVGTSSYLRNNGDRIDAWNVEVGFLVQIYNKLGCFDSSNSISYYHQSLAILYTWKERIDVLTEEQTNLIFNFLSNTESNLCKRYKKVKDWDKAIHYQEQSIVHAKQLKDREDKIKRVYSYMNHLGSLYVNMG
jgi:hypothetical protein